MRISLRAFLPIGLLACLSLPPAARAQVPQIVPPANASEAGDTNNRFPIGAGAAATYQVFYPASQLVGLPIGGRITAMQMRLRNAETSPWPAAATNITSFEVRMGSSTRTTTTLSTSFASNMTDVQVVRAGPLSLAAGAYPGGLPSGATPEPWGPSIRFSNGYIYRGGPLVIEIRTTGSGTIAYADAVSSNTLGATVVAAASNTETSGIITAAAVVVRLEVTPPNTEMVTLPNASDTVEGNTSNSIPPGAFTDGRHMSIYGADQLASVPPGSLITGMQLRLNNAEISSWPTADSTNPDYEILLSRSSLTPATASSTFGDNQLDSVLVHNGPYFIPANAYPAGANAGATPEAWGPVIAFQVPYLYRGGPLVIDIRSAGGIAPSKACDVISGSAAAAGLSAAPRSSGTGSLAAGAFITRISFIPPNTSPFGSGITKIFAIKSYADTPGPSVQNSTTFQASQAMQFVFGPSQFQTVGPGTLLTGLAHRNNTAVAWPAALANATDYTIELSRSQNEPATLSTTIANNTGSDVVTARSGALAVPAGSMAPTTGGSTAPYTWEIPFSSPYSYRFGSLFNVLRNSGFGTTGSVNAIAFNAPEIGVTTRGFFTAGAGSAITPNAGNIPVIRYSADAQVIVPNSVKDGTGLGSFYALNSPYATTDSTFQFIVGASQLTYIPIGGLVTSLDFLADTTQGPWPAAAGARADDYSVEISTAALSPASMSTTFADNTGTDARIVRSGPIAWLAGALPSGASGRFGGQITFDQAFVYTGGDLCVTIRHSAVNGGGPSLIAANPGTAIRVVRSSDKASTSGNYFGLDSGPAVRLGYIPSAVSPVSMLRGDGNGGRFVFAGTRAYQMIYNADQVGVPIGATINGLSLRLETGVTTAFPATDLTLDRFDISMSSAVRTAANMSLTFSENEGSDVTTVRSGPITIAANSFPPNPVGERRFGIFIPFTRPFVYKGGPITMLLRNGNLSGSTGNVEFDASSVGANGVRDTSNANALSGANIVNALVARFAFTDDAFCFADLNNDGLVDDADFVLFLASYNVLDCADPTMAIGCPGDLNFNRVVDDADFVLFLSAYNELLCP